MVSLFRDHKEDESGGQHALRGFSFQVWQAVLEVLRAHAAGGDYAVVLEWQQDVAVLNSSHAPTQVRFVQVKKNESTLHWSVRALLTPPAANDEIGEDASARKAAINAVAATAEGEAKDKPKSKPKTSLKALSTMAKLYFHRRRFADLCSTELVFVSNASYLLDIDGDGDKKVIEAAQLSSLPATAAAKVKDALRRQLVIPSEEPVDLSEFSLQKSDFPLDGAHKHMTGELVELCMLGKIVPNVSAPAVALFIMASYVQGRGGKGAFAKDFEALLKRAVTRADVDTYLAAANDFSVKTEDLVDEVRTRLNSELADPGLVRDMRRESNRACIEITNRASPVWEATKALHGLYTKNDGYSGVSGLLKDRFAQWKDEFRALNVPNASLYNNGYLYCLMAMIFEDANPIKHLSPIPPGAQSEAEK